MGLDPVPVVFANVGAVDFFCEGMVGPSLDPAVHTSVVGIHHNSVEDIFVAVVLVASEVDQGVEEHRHMARQSMRFPLDYPELNLLQTKSLKESLPVL